MDKLYFAVYVNVSGQSPQRAKERLESISKNLNDVDPNAKYYVIGTRSETKMELLFPINASEEIHLSERLDAFVNKISNIQWNQSE